MRGFPWAAPTCRAPGPGTAAGTHKGGREKAGRGRSSAASRQVTPLARPPAAGRRRRPGRPGCPVARPDHRGPPGGPGGSRRPTERGASRVQRRRPGNKARPGRRACATPGAAGPPPPQDRGEGRAPSRRGYSPGSGSPGARAGTNAGGRAGGRTRGGAWTRPLRPGCGGRPQPPRTASLARRQPPGTGAAPTPPPSARRRRAPGAAGPAPAPLPSPQHPSSASGGGAEPRYRPLFTAEPPRQLRGTRPGRETARRKPHPAGRQCAAAAPLGGAERCAPQAAVPPGTARRGPAPPAPLPAAPAACQEPRETIGNIQSRAGRSLIDYRIFSTSSPVKMTVVALLKKHTCMSACCTQVKLIAGENRPVDSASGRCRLPPAALCYPCVSNHTTDLHFVSPRLQLITYRLSGLLDKHPETLSSQD